MSSRAKRIRLSIFMISENISFRTQSTRSRKKLLSIKEIKLKRNEKTLYS